MNKAFKMIVVDDDKWKEFKIKTLQKGTTMSKEIDRFLDKFLEMVK